jgi:hypothetical protein
MAAKTAVATPARLNLDANEIRAQIANAEALVALATSEEQTETLRLPMLRGLAEIGADVDTLSDAEAKIAAAKQKRADAEEHLARLQPLLIIAGWRDLLIQREAKINLIAERTALYAKKKTRWDALQAELYELEPEVQRLASFCGWAGTTSIDEQLARFRLANESALRDAGEIAY